MTAAFDFILPTRVIFGAGTVERVGDVARELGCARVLIVADPGIVRNRLKIASTVENARAFLAVQREVGSFDDYVWSFVGGKPRVNRWRSLAQVPARTPESDALSRDLRRRGFRFVGSTICYAFMQAVGLVNDHTTDCFRYRSLSKGYDRGRGDRGGS